MKLVYLHCFFFLDTIYVMFQMVILNSLGTKPIGTPVGIVEFFFYISIIHIWNYNEFLPNKLCVKPQIDRYR